jgi:hypothetical protein
MAEVKVSDALSATARGATLTEIVLDDGVIDGWIGGGGPLGRASFGYWLGEAHQGRGLLHTPAPAWVKHLQPLHSLGRDPTRKRGKPPRPKQISEDPART